MYFFIKNWTGFNEISSVHLQKIPKMKIFVAGLPYDLDDAELEEIFEKFGKVNSAKVAMDRET
jgi:RNA recognition motif-containing protein